MSGLDNHFDDMSLQEQPKPISSHLAAGSHGGGKFYFEEQGLDQAQLDDIRHFTDDHPEPSLLASSVGKEMNGHIIPSSSTISLLSLQDGPLKNSTSVTSGFHTTLSPPRTTSFGNNYTQRSPYNNIVSRQSHTQLYQKRAPTSGIGSGANVNANMNASINASMSTNTTSNSTPMISSNATTQSIPIYQDRVPDSPSLDPVSLGGSPSRFWLSSQTPPKSMASSLNRVLYKRIHSPVLNPVQTPTGEPPMTPLHLNHCAQQGYFDHQD